MNPIILAIAALGTTLPCVLLTAAESVRHRA